MFLLLGCGGGEPLDNAVLVEGCGDVSVGVLAEHHPGAKEFDRCATAFGVPVFAAEDVSDASLIHVVSVLAEYLDNDEDGVAEDEAVVLSLVDRSASMVVFTDDGGMRRFARSGFSRQLEWQPTWESEMDASTQPFFDASFEEVLHLVNFAGQSEVYPEAFGTGSGTTLTDAMDTARGGHFEDIPDTYPEQGWYHYDDWTCDYGCMATEYLYWAHTSLMGAQAADERCEWISSEWELCTPEQVRETDLAITALLGDPAFSMPTVMPDGDYAP